MSSKRSKLEIIYDLLQAVQEKGGRIKPTHLLYKSNLSHTKMKEYTEELMKQKFLNQVEDKNKKMFEITDKGSKFLMEYKRIKQFSESFGL